MATQLQHTDFAIPPLAPRPNIRVAFSAGAATLAIRDKLAETPAPVRDATLEELTIADLTRGVIATAHQLLSPPMFTAFLRWGEVASRLSTTFETDEEGLRRSSATAEAIRDLATLPMANDHDRAVKHYLLMIEVTESSCCGPINAEDDGETYSLNCLIHGISSDLVPISPVTQSLDQLARAAWVYSASTPSWMLPIGEAVTAAFSAARAIDSIESDHDRQQPLDLSAYDMWMRGPLITWNRQYDRYLAAAEEVAIYDRDVHTPTFAVDGDPVDGDAVQDRYDDLVDAMSVEFDRLLALPAPGPGELAIKLKLWRECDGYHHGNAREVVDKLVIDARRFGNHGAHLQTDKQLLDAYSARRREFEGSYSVEMTTAESDAYFDRCDAYEAVLHNTPATTIAGVLAKLRVAFLHETGELWSDLAIMDPSHPTFVEGIAEAGVFKRLTWSAIEDLARIGGVSLSEQGR